MKPQGRRGARTARGSAPSRGWTHSLSFVLAALSVACQAPHDAHPTDSHANHNETPSEIVLSEEAQRLAGIRLGPVEERVAGGAGMIPAEVEFEPHSTAHLTPLVPGRLVKLMAALGDDVKKGQLLGVVASSDVSAVRADLDRVNAQLVAARAARARQEELAKDGSAARRALIDAEARVSELEGEVKGLSRQLRVLGASGGGELSLRSPMDGTVVAVHATLGERVSPDETTFIITDPTQICIRGHVPELEVGRVARGDRARVRLHAFPDLVLEGEVNYVAPLLDDRTRSLPIHVALDAPDVRLKSGLYGAIELTAKPQDPKSLLVPLSAVAVVDGQSVVFVPGSAPNSFRPQPVSLGHRTGRYQIVTGGLSAGQQVVQSGSFTLKSALKSGELAGHEH